jgi:hypothetical protein
MEPQAASNRYNSNVWNILPLTTFRTIDLAGKKNSDPLFSRFCAETRVFFELNYAPKYVQIASSASQAREALLRLDGRGRPPLHEQGNGTVEISPNTED